MVARCIFINKTDGFRRVAVCAEYDFEKCFGYGDLVFFSDSAVLLAVGPQTI